MYMCVGGHVYVCLGYIFGLFLRKVEDTKGLMKSRKSKDRQHNGQKYKNKHQSTKQYTKI